MSALPPKADIGTQSRNVRFVPKADIGVPPRNRVIRAGTYLFRATLFRYGIKKGLLAGQTPMRVVKGMFPIAVSLSLVAAVTAVLWQVNLTTDGSHRLVYFYLFPVALIAALYNGRLALLCAAMAMASADYFLQEPLYSFANDNPLEYGDLIWFAVLAASGIKFVRVLMRPHAKILEASSGYEQS
jgi:hypothetical protein